MARGSSAVQVYSKDTKNNSVTFHLEEFEGEYFIYQINYEKREDYIISHVDKEFMIKVVNFMAESYNDGFVDGKNNALMFIK